MGISIAIQGILQSLGYALKPLFISLLRLVIFVFPLAYIFTKSKEVTNLVWWTFPISEFLTSIIAVIILKNAYNKKVKNLSVTTKEQNSNYLIISISREHGTNGKEIGRMIAKKLNISFYDKEEIKDFALKNSLNTVVSDTDIYNHYLSLDVSKEAIIAETTVIKAIASKESAVIIGRASDYILKDYPNLIKIFIYAPKSYRIKNIVSNYHDNKTEALKHINKSDQSRATYYGLISNKTWSAKENYDLCINSNIGNEAVAKVICDYINSQKK